MLQARSQELESMQQTIEELRLQIQSMDGTKGWFERRLKDAEVGDGLMDAHGSVLRLYSQSF